jgi:hypothetical protein
MQHHRHPGLALSCTRVAGQLETHPIADACDERAMVVWIPIPDKQGRDVVALEGLQAIPTRAGAMRIAAVPHIAQHLALGDEVAIGQLEDRLLARGSLASALHGTISIVLSPTCTRTWRDIAGDIAPCVIDVADERAFSVSVERPQLSGVFEILNDATERDELQYSYQTAERHSRPADA